MSHQKPEYLRRLNEFPSYKGGDTCISQGYVFEYIPGHRLQNNWGWVAQHRLVAEDMLGRPLVRSGDDTIAECVHHKDSCRTNNDPSNLEVMTRRSHLQHHAKEVACRNMAKIDRGQVIDALDGRTLKEAARFLRVDPMTIRNRFPELLAPRQRKSPAKLEDFVEKVRPMAADPALGYKEIASALGISPVSVHRIVSRNDLPWVRKSKKGEEHKVYRGLPTRSRSEVRGSGTESG